LPIVELDSDRLEAYLLEEDFEGMYKEIAEKYEELIFERAFRE
jgi:hypothetical protein